MSRAIDLAIPVRFAAEQVSAFGAQPASAEAYRAGDFIGDVCAGGSCNCSTLHFTPHCHGTHTESVGHITQEPCPVNTLGQQLYLAQLLSITPEARDDGDATDVWITQQQLQSLLPTDLAITAVIVRTLPNHPEKRQANYDVQSDSIMPPYFEPAALAWLAARGIEHLLVDLPSVDRLLDGGALAAHRAFWHLPAGHQLQDAARPHATITELIYVPDSVADGRYLLNLNIAPISSDAAPSRPILYPLLPDRQP